MFDGDDQGEGVVDEVLGSVAQQVVMQATLVDVI